MTSWVEQLRRHENLCRRAPSAHNTQPWLLRYGTDTITVHWDDTRTLPAADPTRRDLFLSLGALIETCLIVAADAGLAVAAEVSVDETTRRVARLVPAPTPYHTPFTAATVDRRRCARGPYTPGPPPHRLSELGRAHGADLRLLPSRALAAPLTRADRWLFGTTAVVNELRTWLRLSPRHPRYRLDGLTDQALALTRVQALALRAALTPRAHRVGRRLGLPAALAAATRGLLRHDGTVAVLVGQATTPEHLLHHGRTLMRIWLALTHIDHAVHPLSQLLDCPTTAHHLHTHLGLTPHQTLLAVFRIGQPQHEPTPSPRIPTEPTVAG